MASAKPLFNLRVRELLVITASESPTPGGGSSAALAGALAAALVEKVANKTAKREPRAARIARRARALRERLTQTVQEDARSYGRVVAAGRRHNRRALLQALRRAIAVPQGIVADSRAVVRLIHELRPLSSKIWRSDVQCAWLLAEASEGAGLSFVIANRQYMRQCQRIR